MSQSLPKPTELFQIASYCISLLDYNSHRTSPPESFVNLILIGTSYQLDLIDASGTLETISLNPPKTVASAAFRATVYLDSQAQSGPGCLIHYLYALLFVCLLV